MIVYALLINFMTSDIASNTKKMQNTIFAIPAEAPAIPPNPNIPAITATTSKIIIVRNMF